MLMLTGSGREDGTRMRSPCTAVAATVEGGTNAAAGKAATVRVAGCVTFPTVLHSRESRRRT